MPNFVRVTPAKRGRGRKLIQSAAENWLDKLSAEQHASMSWMRRLMWVFGIDTEIRERQLSPVSRPCLALGHYPKRPHFIISRMGVINPKRTM